MGNKQPKAIAVPIEIKEDNIDSFIINDNKKINLTPDQIQKIQNVFFKHHRYNKNKSYPFKFNRTYFNINLTFDIKYGPYDYYLYCNDNYLKIYSSLKKLFDDLNNFETVFVNYDNNIMNITDYNRLIEKLNGQEKFDKEIKEVEEIIKHLNLP